VSVAFTNALTPALGLEQVRQVVPDVLDPRHFFLGDACQLQWEGPVQEEIAWEVFHGRLLDPSHTRLRRSFLAWNVFWMEEAGRAAEPLLAVKLDPEAGQLHVARGILCHVWEGYEADANVYQSREVVRWVRELVGTVTLADVADGGQLRRELADLLFRAVIGVSRLPLTSVESPLPAFSLGQLAYFFQPGTDAAGPLRSPQALLSRALTPERPWPEKAKVLEVVLRSASASELEQAARELTQRWQAVGQRASTIPHLLRTLFNEVALSPYTAFVDNTLAFVQLLVRQRAIGAEAEVDFLSWLLRQLGRHLSAYDLVTFHHRGANYPDALLLDAALKRYLALVEEAPALFMTSPEDAGQEQARRRLRRQALRQGWLLRRRYEGLPVPDAPTSPGENARVLPPPHVRIPEEQILQAGKRRRRLFSGDPLDARLGEKAQAVLRQSIADLQVPEELRELGTAVFIDRPLGVFKAAAEPDLTLLLSHEAFSRSLAEDRLRFLSDNLCALLEDLDVRGLPLSAVQCEEGRIVSLADVRRAAADFLLLRTTRQSVADLLDQYDFAPLAGRFALDFLIRDNRCVIVPAPCRPGAPERTLIVYDGQLRPRLELGFRQEQGYLVRGAREWPRGGLQVLRLWKGEQAHDLRTEALVLAPIPAEPRT
jgi:hypothetical protein